MESIFIRVAQLILSLSILVILHELGHYLPAKWFKTKVEKFFLFFDWPRAIVKKKIGRNRLRNWDVAFGRICKNCRNDRREHGPRTNEKKF